MVPRSMRIAVPLFPLLSSSGKRARHKGVYWKLIVVMCVVAVVFRTSLRAAVHDTTPNTHVQPAYVRAETVSRAVEYFAIPHTYLQLEYAREETDLRATV